MATTSYQSLIDGGHLNMSGVPELVAINAIRRAAIEFCEQSLVWSMSHDAITLVSGEAVYQFEPNIGAVVHRIEQAWVDGVPIDPTTRLDLQSISANWPADTGTPNRYLQENTDELILYPIPAGTGSLTMKVTLKPSRKSTGIESWLVEKYLDVILNGAKYRLMEEPGKPWTDGNAAAYYKNAFDTEIQSARVFAHRGLGKAPLRTKSQFF